MQQILWAGVLTLATLGTAKADVLSGLELSAGIGVLGHNTTGVGDPLLDYGYDREAGPVADAKLRFVFGSNRYFRHGVTFRGGVQRGRAFGRDGFGYRWGFADVGYSFRTILPCMSSQDRRIYAAATLGISGAHADAGTGRGEMGTDANLRRAASDEFDHWALGWVLGGEIEVHFKHFLIGLDIDMRRLYGLDTAQDRTMLSSAVLRLGIGFDFTDHQY
ncbi:MAG: hypothetical protein AAGE52_00685 [Myxococcota bacterium]